MTHFHSTPPRSLQENIGFRLHMKFDLPVWKYESIHQHECATFPSVLHSEGKQMFMAYILRGSVTGNRGMFTPFALFLIWSQGMFPKSFCLLSSSLQILTDLRNMAGLRVPRDVAEAPHQWSSVADLKVKHVQLYQVTTLLSMKTL